jgi:uncharacterized protein (TIGR04255 family)
MVVLPDALTRDAIVECVFEMRFSGGHPAVADLLPGVVFGKLSKYFKTLTPLPLGQVPRVLRDENPQLRYSPTHGLEGPNLRMMFGPHVAAVSIPKPYPGWKKVQPLIVECMASVVDSGLTGAPERFSLKYVNLLQEGSDEFDLSQTTLSLKIGTFKLRTSGTTYVRTEIEQNGCLNVVDIASGAKLAATPGNPEASGVLVSVDTIQDKLSATPFDELAKTLKSLHDTEKQVFFGLLAQPTLAKLGPSYPTTHS